MKKKVLSALFCAAVVASMLAGCQRAIDSNPDSEAPGAADTTAEDTADAKEDADPASEDTLVYWSMWESEEPQGQAIQAAVDAYAEESGVKIKVEFKGHTKICKELEPALAAGQKIDMFDEDIDHVNDVWGDYIMDLEKLAEAADYEATANEPLIEACREAGGGILKSIPYQPNVFAFFYNQDLFDQAGIEAVPTTWDEFKGVCQKLKDAGITPMTMDDIYATSVMGYHLGRYVGEAGVREIVAEDKWDDPAVLKMAKDIEELVTAGYYSEITGSNVWPAGQNSELATGDVAMSLNGSWLPNEVKDIAGKNFKWGCFAYPALDECETNLKNAGATGVETNNLGGQVFAVNKDSQLGEEAFGLITKITKGEFDQKLAEDSIGIPADITNTEWPPLVSCAKPVMEESTSRFTWAAGVESNEDMTPVIKENFLKLIAGSCSAYEFVAAMTAAQ